MRVEGVDAVATLAEPSGSGWLCSSSRPSWLCASTSPSSAAPPEQRLGARHVGGAAVAVVAQQRAQRRRRARVAELGRALEPLPADREEAVLVNHVAVALVVHRLRRRLVVERVEQLAEAEARAHVVGRRRASSRSCAFSLAPLIAPPRASSCCAYSYCASATPAAERSRSRPPPPPPAGRRGTPPGRRGTRPELVPHAAGLGLRRGVAAVAAHAHAVRELEAVEQRVALGERREAAAALLLDEEPRLARRGGPAACSSTARTARHRVSRCAARSTRSPGSYRRTDALHVAVRAVEGAAHARQHAALDPRPGEAPQPRA